MARFRKKPVEIDAWRARDLLHYAEAQREKLPPWIERAYNRGEVFFVNRTRRIEIKTLEGVMHAGEDDWIIRGVKGEVYPCKPDIFEATYERVT